MAARVHNHASNRASAKETIEKKVVFKSVLDNPFRVVWPSVPVNVQEAALTQTSEILEGAPEYQAGRGQEKRKRRLESSAANKKRKTGGDTTAAVPGPASDISAPAASKKFVPAPRPPVLDHLTFGINEVTKRLDAQIRYLRHGKIISVGTKPAAAEQRPPHPTPIKLIVACRADVDPPILIDHLPHEVAAFNSAMPPEPIKMIPLPKGAEASLAKALGLRRVTVIAMDINTPGLDAFENLLESVPTLTAPWLTSLARSAPQLKQQLIPTHVKQMRTTAPKDMKVAKMIRAEGRSAVRERKLLKASEAAKAKAAAEAEKLKGDAPALAP